MIDFSSPTCVLHMIIHSEYIQYLKRKSFLIFKYWFQFLPYSFVKYHVAILMSGFKIWEKNICIWIISLLKDFFLSWVKITSYLKGLNANLLNIERVFKWADQIQIFLSGSFKFLSTLNSIGSHDVDLGLGTHVVFHI